MPHTNTTSELLSRVRSSSVEELTSIAREIRAKIIDTVSRRGGHLAPSLGVVELTLALHHVFESPRDSIVWDVGHQAYAHKIITGRDKAFETLRTRGGVSGFPKRAESPHDPFGAGHSSTSISAALGIAEAKRMAGDPGRTIAVIGDGSMTAGLAFEGLNHAGHVQNKNLIVILNDNQMSIDKNVGALARFMNKGITHPTYNRIRRDARMLLSLISSEDLKLVDLTRRAALVVKDFFLAGSLFEALGFRYFGPIDGHDLSTLVPTMKSIASIVEKEGERASPVLLHVITKKGKGYAPAEEDPSRFHGIGPFDVETGSTPSAPCVIARSASDEAIPIPTYTQVFGETVCDLMEVDARVIAITAAMPSGTGLDIARERFPGRYYDVGIAEPHAVTFAAGMASRGFRPVVAVYSSFLQRAYDQVVHDVCLQNLPVIFALDRAGVVGEDGPTHHGLFDISYLRHLPNLALMAPKDENELRAMLLSAVNYPGPVAIRYPRGKGVGAALEPAPQTIPLGKSEVVFNVTTGQRDNETTGLRDDGTTGRRDDVVPLSRCPVVTSLRSSVVPSSRVTILALGNMVSPAIAAAGELAEKGVDCRVINMRFAKPLDGDAITGELAEGRRLVTIEDGALAGGFGSSVLEFVNSEQRCLAPEGVVSVPGTFADTRIPNPESRIPCKVLRLGYPDHFVEAGKVAELHAHYGLTAEGIAATILASLADHEGERLAEAEDSSQAQPTVLPVTGALKS